jgi:hypothetical protein
MRCNVNRGWWSAALVALLAGCSDGDKAPPDRKEEEQVRQTFAALQKALKDRDADKIWSLLDEDCRADAEAAAKSIRDAYAKATPAERAEQEKALGLPGAELSSLDGRGFVKTKRFHGKHDEIPPSKIEEVVVHYDKATVHYVEPDDDKIKLPMVREKGEWKVYLPKP